MSDAVPHVDDFLWHAFGYAGTPYLWGGKGTTGIDCSGLVTAAYHDAGGPDWRVFHNAQKLFDELPLVELRDAKRGVLTFFGTGDPAAPHISHVGILVGGDLSLESSGGDHTTTSLMEAARKKAFVKVVRTFRRKTFMGLRALPLTY